MPYAPYHHNRITPYTLHTGLSGSYTVGGRTHPPADLPAPNQLTHTGANPDGYAHPGAHPDTGAAHPNA
jgi:hypothetical protein